MTPLVMLLIWLGATYTAHQIEPVPNCMEILNEEHAALTADGWAPMELSTDESGALGVMYARQGAPNVVHVLFLPLDAPEAPADIAKLYVTIKDECHVIDEDGETVRFKLKVYRGAIPIRKSPNTDFEA